MSGAIFKSSSRIKGLRKVLDKQDNPYVVLCPHCGQFICTKCEEIENKLGGLCGCDDCNSYQRRLEKRHKEHLEKYDHSLLVKGGMDV